MAEIFDFGLPPATIMQTTEEMAAIKGARRRGNKRVAESRDTERYLVIVYPSRAAREAALARLGLPVDERYLSGSAFELAIKDGKRIEDALLRAQRECIAAPVAHSGAAG